MPRLGAPAGEQSCLVRALKGCGIGCGVLLIICVIGFLAFRSKITSRPSLPPPSTPVASPGTPTVEQQLAAIREAAKAGPGKPVELRLSEADLNRVATEAAAKGKEVSNIQIRLAGDKMTVSATVDTGGVLGAVPLTATGHPEVTGGKLRFVAESVEAGTMKLPVASVQPRLDQAFGSYDLAKEGVQVTGVQLSNGQLVLSGSTVAPH